jgi:hypothetical protein
MWRTRAGARARERRASRGWRAKWMARARTRGAPRAWTRAWHWGEDGRDRNKKNAHAPGVCLRATVATRRQATRRLTQKSARPRLKKPKSKNRFGLASTKFSRENSERLDGVDHSDERARVVVRRVRRRVGVAGSIRHRVSAPPARGLGRVEPGVELASGAGLGVSPSRFGSVGVAERNGRQHPPGRGERLLRLLRGDPQRNRRAPCRAGVETAVHGRGRGRGGVRVRDASASSPRARVVRREARARPSRRQDARRAQKRDGERRGATRKPGASRHTHGRETPD